MNVAERTQWYADQTGLSKAAITRYRRAPAREWTTGADRKISSTIKAVERMAADPELSWDDWARQAGRLLDVVYKWVSGVLDKVSEFVTRVANAVTKVVKALTKLLVAAKPLVAAIARLFGYEPKRLLTAGNPAQG